MPSAGVTLGGKLLNLSEPPFKKSETMETAVPTLLGGKKG